MKPSLVLTYKSTIFIILITINLYSGINNLLLISKLPYVCTCFMYIAINFNKIVNNTYSVHSCKWTANCQTKSKFLQILSVNHESDITTSQWTEWLYKSSCRGKLRMNDE